MKHALGLVALAVCVAIVVPPAGAQLPKTAITGTVPFSLGMSSADARSADATLTTVSAAVCGTPAHGAAYATHVTAPIGGYPYKASLVLCFADDKLGAIALMWPQDTFQEDNIRWQVAMRALAAQLAASYAPGLVRRSALDEDMGGVLEMADGQGNLLSLTAVPGADPRLAMIYMSADYDQAINGKWTTVTSY